MRSSDGTREADQGFLDADELEKDVIEIDALDANSIRGREAVLQVVIPQRRTSAWNKTISPTRKRKLPDNPAADSHSQSKIAKVALQPSSVKDGCANEKSMAEKPPIRAKNTEEQRFSPTVSDGLDGAEFLEPIQTEEDVIILGRYFLKTLLDRAGKAQGEIDMTTEQVLG